MKLRIIAVLTALTSFATMFVGCNKEIPPCAEHVDANNDKLCDGCKRAVINIVEELPYEEPVVDMVVKTAPANAVFTDYVVSTLEEDELVLTGKAKKEEANVNELLMGEKSGRYFYYYSQEVDETKDPVEYSETYRVYDLVKGKDLFKKTVKSNVENYYDRDTYSISLDSMYFCVTKTSVDAPIEYTYYTYDLEASYTTNEQATSTSASGGLTYVYFETKVLVLDSENYTIFDEYDGINTFVERPNFDYTTENYGICEVDDKLLVYDLGELIDCVYSFALPSSHQDVSKWLLAGDKMLIQSYEPLLPTAVNFDIEKNGAKYDIHYTVVDFATKTATEQEFGYIIEEVIVNNENMTELAKNMVIVNEVVDKKEDANKQHEFVIDEKLDILFEYKAMHIAQDGVNMTLVADGLFTADLKYADGTVVTAVFDAEGNFQNYMPRNYDVVLGMLHIDGAFYTYTLDTVFDYAEKDYTLYAVFENYVIFRLVEETDEPGVMMTTYYYYDGVMSEPAKISNKVVWANEYGYCTEKKTVVEEEGVEIDVYTYTLYNQNKEKIADFESAVENIVCMDEETGMFVITLANGEIYAVR